MRVLLATIVVICYVVEQLHAITCPANRPYQYSGICYAECPWVPPDVTYLDATTGTCVTACPSYPIMTYYDHMRQKCVEMCPSAPSEFAYIANRSCLAECPDPLYANDATRQCVGACPTGMFYQIDGTLRVCTSRCYPGYYANQSKICVVGASCPSSPVKFYGDDLSGLCVKSCPQNVGTYAEQSTRMCVQHCSLGTFADPTSLRCVSECPSSPQYYGSNTTRMCHLKCIEGEFSNRNDRQCYAVCPQGFGDYSTRTCVNLCPESNGTFADPETKLCVEVCSPGYFADNATRACVSSVDCTGDLVGEPLTLKCVNGQNCPVGFVIDYTLFMCVKRCNTGEYVNLDTRICGPTCPWNPPINITFKQESTRTCVLQCPSNPRTFSDNQTQSCVDKCPDPHFGSPTNYDCVETCPDGFYGQTDTNLCVSTCTTNASVILYFYSPNTSCLSSCPQYTYADNTTLTCVTTCPQNTFAYQLTNTCVSKCPDDTFGDYHSRSCVDKCPQITEQYADDSTNLCVTVCPLEPDYFGEDLNDGDRKCVLGCTLAGVFADPVTRTCVEECNIKEGYFGYSTSGRCVLKCPLGYANPITKRCTATCPQSPVQTFGDNLTASCVTKCPNNTYGDKTIEMCVNATDCPSLTYGDDSTNLCVPKCSSLLKLFGDPVTKKCVKSCQFSYYSDNTTRLCTQTCNTTAKLYKDPSSRRCVLNCPAVPDLYNDPAVMKCVPNCTGAAYPYKFHYLTQRKCISMCPSSPAYFADQQTKTCVLKCANLTFKFINNTYRGCLSACPLQIFNATKNLTLYEDNTTWTCVSVCPLGYYSFKHPTDNSIRKCVKMCQIVAGVYYFADDVTRSCVTECPTKVHNTWGDRLVFKCMKSCTRKQYRDITTKQCVYSCPDAPIQYFADNSTWNCTKKCPNDTFAESINNTCVKQCPSNYFGYNQKCLSQCPAGTSVYQDNTTWFCVNKCSQLPDYYSDPQNQKCVKNCTPGTFADAGTRKCVDAVECSNGTVADPLTYRCVSRCSKTPMYYAMSSTNLCGSVCDDGLFAFNDTNQCIEACPAPYYGVNSSANFYCIEYCPTPQLKFINSTSLFRICLDSGCPEGYFAYLPTMQCVQLCPNGYWGNQATNQCVQDCTPLYADDTTNMCVGICPNGTTADNNTYSCKGKCNYGEFSEGKVCVSDCSVGLFADNLTRACVDSCPQDPFTFADPFEKKCVRQCSIGYFGFFDNRTCQTECPAGLFTETTLRLCINPCLEGQLGDPSSQECVTSCTTLTFPYADPTTQQCVALCPSSPDLYGFNNKCLDHCPSTKFAQNSTRTCVGICPNKSATILNESFADDLTRRCVQRCSALSYAYKNATHSVCLDECPDGWFASEIQQACVEQCPNTTYARNDTKECVSRCPSGTWGDGLTRVCMDGCYNDGFADNSTNTCVYKCPGDPDLYGDLSTNSCVLTCGTGLFSHPVDRMCVTDCDTPYYADPSSQLCVLTCPTHELQFADDQTRTCVASCTNHSGVIYYSDPITKRCLSQCPQSPQLLYGVNITNTCEQTCPPATYGDNDTRVCLDKCVFQSPRFTWMDRVDNMCVQQCPLNYFADNTTKGCEQSCSVGMYADNTTRRCVYGCPVDPSLFATFDDLGNPVCSYTCKSGLYADQVSRSCVKKCPLSPFYYFHMNLTNSCERECVYPYFGEQSTQFCVAKCQDGFYGNLTTKKCEACRTQCVTCSAYLECLTCQIGFYLYEYECVTVCPTYPILYFSLQNSAKCYRKCPQPYFGLQSTKKCQLGCPVSYYTNNNTRICTTCPTGCLSCNSAGCLTCYTGYTYVNTSRTCNQYCNSTHIYFFKDQCYNACPDGSFLTKDLVHCDPCATDCAKCSLTAGNCTKCAQKFYYQGLCVDACPSEYFVNEDLACIACSVNPDMCKLDPLTYSITPFTQNYQQKAYVTFSRPVSMTLDEFAQAVQINFNGKALKAGQFSGKVYNTTTYVVTILVSVNEESLKIEYKPRSMQQVTQPQQAIQLKDINQDQSIIYESSHRQFSTPTYSPNENTLTIGFKPGTITDTSGNLLTINTLEQKFQSATNVVSQQTLQTTDRIHTSTSAVTWVFVGVVLLLLIKTSYPVLVFLECMQIVYMHVFLLAGPMPFLELRFLDAVKQAHFTFFPRLFAAGVNEKAYESVASDLSFLANCSPLIFVWLIVGLIYLLFTILSSKKIKVSKTVRKFAKRTIKYRLRYGIINDAFWITYIYAMFFAMYQFKNASFGSSILVGNFFFACIVTVLYLLFTLYMVKLAGRFKDKPKEQISKKFRFITPQPSSFPMQMPMRYIRKLMICFALIMPSFQAQVIIMLMSNLVFMAYIMCFTPSKSKLTNYVNLAIEIGYVIIEGMFYAYFKLEDKTLEEQNGFAYGLIAVEGLVVVVAFLWMVYRFVADLKESSTWQYVYMKLTENRDPTYLKEEQRKRDLEFDFGSMDNRSQGDGGLSGDLDVTSKNLNPMRQLRTSGSTQVFFDAEIGMKKQKSKEKQKEPKEKKNIKKPTTESELSLSINSKPHQNNFLPSNDQISSSQDKFDNSLSSSIKIIEPKTTRIKSPFVGKRDQFLKIDNRTEHELQEIVIHHGVEGEDFQEKKGHWDDVEFDENQI